MMQIHDLIDMMARAGFHHTEFQNPRLQKAALYLLTEGKADELMMNVSQRRGVSALVEVAVAATLQVAGLHTVSLTREMMEKVNASTRYSDGTMTIILHQQGTENGPPPETPL